MKVKEHYANHLSSFYSWMVGDFESAKEQFKSFLSEYDISPTGSGQAMDLGSGQGIQTIALLESGYKVTSIDFDPFLLAELKEKSTSMAVKIVHGDFLKSLDETSHQVELISCCGDTISHLETFNELDDLFRKCYTLLENGGKLILSFRDYAAPLEDTKRFIPVKSDENRILTCILDYSEDKVMVTDQLYENRAGRWVQKISSYEKLRLKLPDVKERCESAGFNLKISEVRNRMEYLILEKTK